MESQSEVLGSVCFRLISRSEDEAISEMPIEKGVLNPFGVVNAGAILWLADVTASLLLLEGADLSEGMKGFPLAINLNANLVGNAREGAFVAKSNYVKRGYSVSIVRTIVKDLEHNLIAEVTTNHVTSK